MNDRYITPADVAFIKAQGYRVFVPEKGLTTYLNYTDGQRIGYLERSVFGGFNVSTVHVPNRTNGTGFRMLDGVDLTAAALSEGLAHSPHWASGEVRKWPSLEAFLKSNTIIRMVELEEVA